MAKGIVALKPHVCHWRRRQLAERRRRKCFPFCVFVMIVSAATVVITAFLTWNFCLIFKDDVLLKRLRIIDVQNANDDDNHGNNHDNDNKNINEINGHFLASVSNPAAVPDKRLETLYIAIGAYLVVFLSCLLAFVVHCWLSIRNNARRRLRDKLRKEKMRYMFP